MMSHVAINGGVRKGEKLSTPGTTKLINSLLTSVVTNDRTDDVA